MDIGEQKKFEYLMKDPHLSLDFINFICGDLIGEGTFRDVYEYNLDPKWVVKVEKETHTNSNVLEWEIWQLVKDCVYSEWFAEVSWISGNNRIMLQRRTKPLYSKEDKIPDKIPGFFTDIKPSNFGWIGNQLVAHDYASTLVRLGWYGFNNKMINFKKRLNE